MYLSAEQGFDIDSDHDTRSSSGEDVFNTANSFTDPGTGNKTIILSMKIMSERYQKLLSIVRLFVVFI